MGYKKSVFNVEISELDDGQKLIYNTYTGVFGIMDLKTQGIYKGIENSCESYHKDGDIWQSIDAMYKAGYIVDSQNDEIAKLKLGRAIGRHNQNYLALTIAPTMDCNMCCPYCTWGWRTQVQSYSSHLQRPPKTSLSRLPPPKIQI